MTEESKAGPEALPAETATVGVVKTGPAKTFIRLGVALAIGLWLIPSLLHRKQAFVIAVLWVIAISIIAPFAADEATHFGKAALQATAVWFAAFVGLPAASIVISGRDPGDDAMALLFPVVLFPGLMILVGVVRFLRQSLRRHPG